MAIRSKESKDIAGYLTLIDPHKSIIDEEKYELSIQVNSNSTWTLSSICLGALIIIFIWYSKRKPVEFQRQESVLSENSDYQLSEVSLTPSFQSRYEYDYFIYFVNMFLSFRYIVEYDHVRFLGRGCFGVVFEARNKLDERRVAIKRVSFKK